MLNNIKANRCQRDLIRNRLPAFFPTATFLDLPRSQILIHLIYNPWEPSFTGSSQNQDVRVIRQMPLRNSSTLYSVCSLHQPDLRSCQVMTVLFDRTHFHKAILTDNNMLFVSNLLLKAPKLFRSVAKTYVKVAILLGVGWSLKILSNIGILMALLHCYRASPFSDAL